VQIINDAAAKQNKKRKVTKLSYNRNRNPTNHRSLIASSLINLQSKQSHQKIF